MKVIGIIEKRCKCQIAEVTAKEVDATHILYKKDINAPYTITMDKNNVTYYVKYNGEVELCGDCIEFALDIITCFFEDRKKDFIEHFFIKDDATDNENFDNMISQTLNTLIKSELFNKAAVMFYNPKRSKLRGVQIDGRTPYSDSQKELFCKRVIDITKETFDAFPKSAVITEGELSDIFSRLENEKMSNYPIVSPIINGKKVFGILAVYSDDKYNIKHIHACSSTAGFIAATISANIVYKSYALSLSSEKSLAGQLKNNERLLSLGTYAAAIVHEIKNPLISIGGFAKRLINAINDPNLQKMANIISSESERLERLAEDILSYTKKHNPNKMQLDLYDELENLKALFEVRSHATNIDIVTDAPENIMVDADRNHFRQVLVNLIANAMVAIGENGEIRISYENRGDFHIIKVADTGGGIPQDNLAKLFKPFFTTSPKGTGLGLAISKKIMTNHGGDITVKNNDKGAEFTLLLPK